MKLQLNRRGLFNPQWLESTLIALIMTFNNLWCFLHFSIQINDNI